MLGLGFIKFHKYVFQVMKDTAIKEKRFHTLVKSLLKIIKSYIKVVLGTYRSIVSDRLRLAKQKNELQKKLNEEIKRAIRFLRFVDKQLDTIGIHPRKKKHYWKSFFKSGKIREDLYNQILREMR